MERVMILTKNVLAGQPLQDQLQLLNYEVYCSSSMVDWQAYTAKTPGIMSYFQFIIFGEAISNEEVKNFVKNNRLSAILLRRGEQQKDMTEIHGWIDSDCNGERLREQLIQAKRSSNRLISEDAGDMDFSSTESPREFLVNKFILLKGLRFSKTEKKVLTLLFESDSKLMTRRDLCLKIWNTEPNNSNQSQLSSIIKRLKSKLKNVLPNEESIITVWGEGYMLSLELLKLIKTQQYL